MYVNKIIHMAVVRDQKGQIILEDGMAVGTWLLPVAACFYRADRSACPEQQFWREVAARAVLDALGFTPPLRDSKNQVERAATILDAQKWFRYDGEDLALVFHMAGMPHEPVRDAVIRLIDDRGIR